MSDVTGSVSFAPEGDGNKNSKNNNPGKETPKEWSGGGDTRKDKSSGIYPNQSLVHRSRSGHNFVIDDSKGAESVTLQHRSGTSVQMKPDGQMLITSHNGKYEITFGEDRMTITGARDITVKGDASMRVYGDYNVTCHKNYNLTVMGDLNITAKNKNQLIRGNKDTIMKNETKKLEGSSSVTAGGGIARVAAGTMTVSSQSGSTYLVGSKGLHASVTQQGDMTFDHKGEGNMHMNVEKGFFDGKFSDGSNEVSMVAKEGKLHMKSDKSMNLSTDDKMKFDAQQDIGMKAQQKVQIESQSGTEVKSQGDIHVNAQGSAGLEGSQTHVGRSAGTTHVIGSTTHLEGQSALNLNGGGGQSFNGQFSFNFENVLSSAGMPEISSGGAIMSEEEPDADSWTRGLL